MRESAGFPRNYEEILALGLGTQPFCQLLCRLCVLFEEFYFSPSDNFGTTLAVQKELWVLRPKSFGMMVGAPRYELGTSWSRIQCNLRSSPTHSN